jgi:hypothetical protein
MGTAGGCGNDTISEKRNIFILLFLRILATIIGKVFHSFGELVSSNDFSAVQSPSMLRIYNAKTQYRESKPIFPEKDLRGLSSNFHIHVSVSDLNIPTIGLPILLQGNLWIDPGNI